MNNDKDLDKVYFGDGGTWFGGFHVVIGVNDDESTLQLVSFEKEDFKTIRTVSSWEFSLEKRNVIGHMSKQPENYAYEGPKEFVI